MNSQSIPGVACSTASSRIIQIAFDTITVALWHTRPGNRGSCSLQEARARNSGGGPPRQHGGLRLLPDNWLEATQAVRITAVKALSSFQFCFPDRFRTVMKQSLQIESVVPSRLERWANFPRLVISSAIS
jgi:hypothetical protein